LLRGNTARSRRRTGIPARARVRAAVAPAGPAPTTRTGPWRSEGESMATNWIKSLDSAGRPLKRHYRPGLGPRLSTLRREPGCGIVILALGRKFGAFMPVIAVIARTLAKAGRILAPCVLVCLCASLADAAPHRARHRAEPAQCGTELTLRALRKQQTGSGPIARHSFRINRGLPHTTTLFQRGSHARSGEDEAAIQNDALDASTSGDDRIAPGLRPLGIITPSVSRLPSATPFTSRSPRGPPFGV